MDPIKEPGAEHHAVRAAASHAAGHAGDGRK